MPQSIQVKREHIYAPIIHSPDWSQPFELMCDASDFAVGAVLGQKIKNQPHVIYYASRTLNEAQMNYTTTEKEFLAVVFALKKFRSYMIRSEITIYTYHVALRYLLTKQDAKACLIRWILLLQEFVLCIKDKKVCDNLVADHLSRLPNAPSSDIPINEYFPDEQLFAILREPWFADIVNGLVTKKTPPGWSNQDKYRFSAQLKHFFWDDPYLFKYYPD